jgi:hypothetical protein
MKRSVYFIGFLLMFLLLSCVKNSDTSTNLIAEEAVITSFYLYSDSIKTIDDYEFTIDNDSMLIYNYDSIDYGTRIDSLSFVVTPRFSAIYVNDSIDFYNSSGLVLDFNQRIKITVVAKDEKESADYYVQVNVHKVDPDTFVWKGIKSEVFAGDATKAKAVYFNGKLVYMAVVADKLVAYESEDGAEWSMIETAGIDVDLATLDLDYLVATDGYLYVSANGRLYQSADASEWVLVETSGEAVENLLFGMENKVYGVTTDRVLARLDGSEWVALGALPSRFPVEGGAVLVAAAPSGKERAFVVGGIDAEGNYLSSVWSSEDGAYWSDMAGGKEMFTPRAYAALAQYARGLMLFGGVTKSEGVDVKVVEDAQLYSKDYGLNWGDPKDKSTIGDLYVPRYEHSAVVTPAGYIYLIGGRASEGATINDVWRGMNYASLPRFRR